MSRFRCAMPWPRASRHPVVLVLQVALLAAAHQALGQHLSTGSLLLPPNNSGSSANSAVGSADAATSSSSRSSRSRPAALASAANNSTHFKLEDYFRRGEDLVNLIVVFKHQKHLDKFSGLCSRARLLRKQQRLQQLHSLVEQHTDTVAASSGSADSTSTASSNGSSSEAISGAHPACGDLEGSCRHMFKSAMAGLAGKFTRQQFIALQHCAGDDAIDYIEKDGQVSKAEHGTYKDWWRNRPPPGTTLQQLLTLHSQQLLKQRQQKQRVDSNDMGTSSSGVEAYDSSSSNNSSGSHGGTPDGTVAGGMNLTEDNNNLLLSLKDRNSAPNLRQILQPGQLWRMLLAEVGLSAQRQLSSGVPNIAVAATSGPSSYSSSAATAAPTVSAAEGENGSAAAQPLGKQQGEDVAVGVDGAEEPSRVGADDQSQVTKNQDPGLAVDAAAIANPEIIALSPHDGSQTRSTTSDQQPLPQQQVNTANEQPGVKLQKLVTALWNLDRIDQRKLPLDGTFSYGTANHLGTGKGVTIYPIDSGIRTSHQEFQPWGGGSSRARAGPDFVDDDNSADDCDGHGTHVSSTAAGRSVGIAKDAEVVAVRVLDCDGAGSISNVVAALDWVAEHAAKPAVASMSLGVPSGIWSQSLETAVKNLVAKGIPVVVAAGNSAQDSCQVAPARVPEAVTVAASNLPNKFQQTSSGDTENLYRWSNTGACIDVFAPGVDIYGACGGPSRCETVTDDAYTWASGTSMAAPHVTGLIAVYLEANPNATPAQVQDALIAASSDGVLQDDMMLPDTPNRLLYSMDFEDQQVPVKATDSAQKGS